MPRLTAIEFSEDTCVLVRVVARGASVEVHGVEILDPAAFPGNTFTRALRERRRTGKFPRRARVVLWGVPDGAGVRDPAVKARLTPLEDAGFHVERVVSPCNALAALARLRVPRQDGAVIWLGIDRAAVAVVAARPGELLYSHAFAWDSSVGAIGSQARLLQRYSLVAFLAPEVRRAMEAVRKSGGRVEIVVTCGSLADLRSLTMPLIEELDIEVETLDSLADLTVPGPLKDRLAELAPAIRIACAGAFTRPSRPRRVETAERGSSWLKIAALIILAVAAAIAAAFFLPRWWRATPSPAVQQSESRREVPSTTGPVAQPERAPSASETEAGRPTTGGQPSRQVPRATSPTRQRRASAPSSVRRQEPSERTAREGPPVQSREPAGSSTDTSAQLPQISRRPLYAPSSHADKPSAEPLNDPLPNITTILVAPNRRFAIVDGRIIGVGDRVGRRTVAAIEPRVVTFREPSGVHIRVGLGGRRASN